MIILWEPEKDERLKRECGVGFESVRQAIEKGAVLGDLVHLRRPGQRMFAVRINGYVCAVPYVMGDGCIFLKTIFQDRKLYAMFGDHNGKTGA